MKKNLSKAIAIVLVFVPGLAFAAANDVQLGVTNTVLSVNSATVTVAGTASTTVEQIAVDTSTFTLTFAVGSTITITAPDIDVVSMSTVQPVTTSCTAGVTTLTITASSAGTAILRPSATACNTAAASSGGGGTISGLIGGGGGGGSSTAIIPTVTTPVTAPTTPTPTPTFTTNLDVGDEGASVTALQTFLVNNGFLVMPTGVSMGYFGELTRAALANFQAAFSIEPSVGFFGPLTRQVVNAMSD
jgi:hypothetical protein